MINGNIVENYACELRSEKHKIIADVDSSLNGTDLGMNPHEILESALAACTLMTIKMYAQRKNIELGLLDVKVKILKEGIESTIDRKINFDKSLDNEMKAKLLNIANRCPIHRLLISNIDILTEIE